MITSVEIAAAEFPVVKVRAGYEIDEVKQFFAVIADALRHYEMGGATGIVITAKEVSRTGLQPTKFREGWGQPEVDAVIREAVKTLKEYEAR